jgi:hypothetical protein
LKTVLHRHAAMTISAERAIAETRAWVDRAVVGLNLCPFAKAVQVKGQVRYVHSAAEEAQTLLAALRDELLFLAHADPVQTETTLLIHPHALTAFADFNDFLADAEATVRGLGLEGDIQVASFHPQYRFAGTTAEDITNATNRSPYPTLHLLREASIERAVAAFPDASAIYETNMQTLQVLGHEEWAALQQRCANDASGVPDASPQ